MNRTAVRVIAGILVAFVLFAGAAGLFVWWKIAGLKDQLVHDLGKAIGAQVQIAAVDLDLWKGELHAAGISLKNDRVSAPWTKGDISQVTARFHLQDVFAATLPLEVEVSSWSLTLHSDTSAPPDSSAPSLGAHLPEASEPTSPPARHRLQVTHLSAHEGSVEIDLADNKTVVLHGVAFEASDNGTAVWTTQLQASSIVAGSLEAGASSVELRATRDQLTFSNLKLACDQGFITGEGDAALDGNHQAHVTLNATNVPVLMLVSVDWQMKLSGLVSGNVAYERNDLSASAKGQLAMSHAKFNVLPWLGQVTALVSLPDITNVEVDHATSDFEWKNQSLHLLNIDVRKTDVVRIGGTVDVAPAGQVDGKLKLGLPLAVGAKWPLLQEKIFSVQQDDYLWADVHLTGTPDHLQEDLTSRLVAIGLQDSNGLLNQATQKATDLLNSFLGK